MQVTPVSSNLIVSFTSLSFQNVSTVLGIMSVLAHSIPVEQLAAEVSQGACVPGNADLTLCSNIQQWIQTLCTICGLCLKHPFDCNTYLCVSSPRKDIGKSLRQSCLQKAQQKISHDSTSGIRASSSSFHVASGIHASSSPFHVLSPTTSHHKAQHCQKV